jgi:nucleotide-binding universal stress UspA family protein
MIELPPFALVAPPEGQGQARLRAQRQLDEAASWAEREGIMSRTAMGAGEDDARCIVDAARQGRCDLIVVACDEGNAVKRLLTGSVVPGLVTASSVPVLVCKLQTPAPPLPARRHPPPAPGPVHG